MPRLSAARVHHPFDSARTSFITLAVVTILALVAILATSGCAQRPDSAGAATAQASPAGDAPDIRPGFATVDELDPPVLISHRGGAAVYPEESMAGFNASAAEGFLPEMDIHFLADGTPVLLHDDTVDRTLEGVTGPVADLDREEWDSARIRHPRGGPTSPTVTLAEVLDRFGGTIVLVPEIKPGASVEQITQVLDIFDARKLRDNLIVQSFDWKAARLIAERGYTTLYLFSKPPAQSPSDIRAAGIDWVGPSAKLPGDELSKFADSGLHVAPYGLLDGDDIAALPAGMSGYFLNDPWNA